MQFCHIAPTSYIQPLGLDQAPCQLLLAHLVEGDKKYAEIYKTSSENRQVTILDNSAYELFREGKPMFDPNKMVELGKRVDADYLVLPDHPGHDSTKTITHGLEYAEQFRNAGFGTFFVPQSFVGDIKDYTNCFAFAATSPHVDYIGVSILGCPNAFGVDKNTYQQFLARPLMLSLLQQSGLLQLAKQNGKKIHCLGMTDGPREIDLIRALGLLDFIDTWDSSAAVWAGINGITFDETPTGLRDGKIRSAVNFAVDFDQSRVSNIEFNMKFIEEMY